MYFFAVCRLVFLHLNEWPRIRVNWWVDDDRATCSSHVHQCPVDFHQRFPVGGRFRYPSPEYCAPVWRLVRLEGLSVNNYVHVQVEAVKITEVIGVLTERWPFAAGIFFFQLELNLTHRESSRCVSLLVALRKFFSLHAVEKRELGITSVERVPVDDTTPHLPSLSSGSCRRSGAVCQTILSRVAVTCAGGQSASAPL